MKNILLSLLLVITGIYLVSCNSNPEVDRTSALQRYNNEEFHISLNYPSNWSENKSYDPARLEGQDGFFQISASEGDSIDQVAEREINHVLKPYGSKPQIESLSIEGNEAQLILPSEDQPKDMIGQAELIIKYPQAVGIDNEDYSFFIVSADVEHIREIASTIHLLR
ncbi:peptidase M56 [Paenibacillus sp. sgz500958]|uniref:peptidase M56 n=1 Tax=Paenibacillus sp. sgz500958 TaxID=3242475 RepID=UPI0036D303AD